MFTEKELFDSVVPLLELHSDAFWKRGHQGLTYCQCPVAIAARALAEALPKKDTSIDINDALEVLNKRYIWNMNELMAEFMSHGYNESEIQKVMFKLVVDKRYVDVSWNAQYQVSRHGREYLDSKAMAH